MLEFLT